MWLSGSQWPLTNQLLTNHQSRLTTSSLLSQVGDVAVDALDEFAGFCFQLFQICLAVRFISADIEVVDYLFDRTSGNSTKLNEGDC